MKIELRNFKHHPDMSEETDCFSASIHHNYRKVGEIQNTGKGGSHRITWLNKDSEKQFNAWVVTLPPHETDEKDIPVLPMNADLFFSLMAGKLIEDNHQKALIKRGICIKLDTTPKGAWEIYKLPYTPENLAKVKAKHGAKLLRVLNEELCAP